MSLTRIHNLSISLDGFATGEPQSVEAPFGHAGQRLHEWMFRTRFWALATAPGGATDGGRIGARRPGVRGTSQHRVRSRDHGRQRRLKQAWVGRR